MSIVWMTMSLLLTVFFTGKAYTHVLEGSWLVGGVAVFGAVVSGLLFILQLAKEFDVM